MDIGKVQLEQAVPARYVPTFAQTLTVAGFVIHAFRRYELYAACHAARFDRLGTEIRYLFALTEQSKFAPELVDEILRDAEAEGRVAVLIAATADGQTLDWDTFFDRLGGPVPSWRALSDSYATDLRTLGINELPPGYVGEPWFLFETAVADGFEFLTGRRVRRLGGAHRGKDLPDSVCLTPDRAVLVLDTKASGEPYSVNKTNLRPLEDYVSRQKLAQQGQPNVCSALIVATAFRQGGEELLDQCTRFSADTGVPLCLVTVDSLLMHVDLARSASTFRNAISWRQVFCKPGLAEASRLAKEIAKTTLTRVGPAE